MNKKTIIAIVVALLTAVIAAITMWGHEETAVVVPEVAPVVAPVAPTEPVVPSADVTVTAPAAAPLPGN
jgi:hypothetical protein